MKIDKGVTIPPKGNGVSTGRPREYPFPSMKVGDSFLAIGKTADNLSSASTNFAVSAGAPWKFKVRTTPDGPRVWRVS